MRLFDLHCDTIEELKKRGEDYLNCTTQFSLRDREKFQKAVQVMAVFVPDDIRGQEAVQFVLDYHQYMDDQVRRTGGQAELVEKITDLDRILDEGKWAFIRSIESGAAINGDLDNINRFADLNFKMLGLVWNGANELEVFFSRYEFSTPCLLAQSDCESLSIDALLALEPDPEKARHEFLQTRLGYSPNDGSPALRQAVSGLYRHMAEKDVLLFTGAQEGIFACMNVLLEPGDHVICQFPGYQSLYDLPRALGCHVDFWRQEAEGDGGWRLDLDVLKSLIRPENQACCHQFTA